MAKRYYSLSQTTVNIDVSATEGAYEWWRHTIGHGGINSHPLPARVIEGAAKLKPRLIRTFIQQYFEIYPDHDQFDWTLLDPYMESLAATGGKVVAAITIKPQVLFPHINQYDVMPNNIEEWQKVVRELVKRYSVDKQIVTYWEIGNEPDIGENGGCPYYFRTPEQYNEFYRFTTEAILSVCPQAKVGGPVLANPNDAMMIELIKYCRTNDYRLDFVSWHFYNRDPQRHKSFVDKFKAMLEESGIQPLPETLVTEWSTSFEPVSIEELAYAPERAAMIAAGIMAMMEAGLDYSFYYHVWDQVNYIDEFDKFFEDTYIMTKHWNEIPHRFGLFGVDTEVRPQYFVYQMFSRLGEEKLSTKLEGDNILVHAAKKEGGVSVIVVNYEMDSTVDRVVNLQFENLTPGRKVLQVYRVDEKHNWSTEEMELIPIERRETDTSSKFFSQIYSPANSVTMFALEQMT